MSISNFHVPVPSFFIFPKLLAVSLQLPWLVLSTSGKNSSRSAGWSHLQRLLFPHCLGSYLGFNDLLTMFIPHSQVWRSFTFMKKMEANEELRRSSIFLLSCISLRASVSVYCPGHFDASKIFLKLWFIFLWLQSSSCDFYSYTNLSFSP